MTGLSHSSLVILVQNTRPALDQTRKELPTLYDMEAFVQNYLLHWQFQYIKIHDEIIELEGTCRQNHENHESQVPPSPCPTLSKPHRHYQYHSTFLLCLDALPNPELQATPRFYWSGHAYKTYLSTLNSSPGESLKYKYLGGKKLSVFTNTSGGPVTPAYDMRVSFDYSFSLLIYTINQNICHSTSKITLKVIPMPFPPELLAFLALVHLNCCSSLLCMSFS